MPYPLDNRPTSLEVDYHALRRRIGAYLGFGRHHAEWDDEQNAIVNDIIDDGTRMAYYPPAIGAPYVVGTIDSHEWSFLRPIWLFTTVASQRRYVTPSDFDRPLDSIGYRDENYAYSPIRHASASRLDMLLGRDDSEAPPELFALEPAESTGEAEQSQLLVLHPTPDAAYQLSLQYQAVGRKLTVDQPHILGGQSFSPVVLAACLAAAELQSTGQQGSLNGAFMSQLATAILRDRKRNAAYLGYNGGADDGPMGRGTARKLGYIYYNDMTYDGTLYPD